MLLDSISTYSWILTPSREKHKDMNTGENSTVDGEAIPIHLKIVRRLIERGEHFMILFIYLIVNPAFRITVKSMLWEATHNKSAVAVKLHWVLASE